MLSLINRLHLGPAIGRVFLRLATRPATAPLMADLAARILAARVRPIVPPAPGKRLTLFALSFQRVQPDATALAKSGEFNVLTLPDNDQFVLQAPFFPNRADTTAFRVDPRIGEMAERFRDFLVLFWPRFMGRIGASAVIGAHFKYKQDIHWGPAAQRAGYPHFVLYRESLKLAASEQETLIRVCRRIGKFEGQAVLTWSKTIGDVLVASGSVSPDQVVVTGNIHLSRFMTQARAARSLAPAGARRTATLFSFTPGVSLNALNAGSFPANPYLGWVRIFERTHSAFARAAQEMPEHRFVIKTKWGRQWYDRVREAIRSRGIDPDLPNLEITADLDPNELILESSAVVTFASTTLLEAGFCGRQVLVPDFDEALDPYYRQHLKLTDSYAAVTVAHSADEIVQWLKDHLNQPRALSDSAQAHLDRLFATYVSPLDEDPLQKCVRTIRDTVSGAASKQRAA